mmetsp:Transcript_17964/g.54972  ORF Transcript_17964/g.54972 Transcript_17964/m.54972 type:complete len:322 (-) Transcript_17964:347-1312(-)
MLGELSLEGGCVPSPEALTKWASTSDTSKKPRDNDMSKRPTIPKAKSMPTRVNGGVVESQPKEEDEHSSSSPKEGDSTSAEASLRRENARLRAELERAKLANEKWASAASALVNVLLMSPRQNDNYASEVRKQLEKALGSLSVVERIRYVNCSFPASKAHAPSVKLVRWHALDDSEWELRWSPAWSCEVVVDGRQVISFSTLLRVSGVAITGRLKLAFSKDLSKLKLQFAETPATSLAVDCKVIIGKVPLPIQETMGNLIRDGALRWINDNLVAPNDLSITLHERERPLSDQEYEQAKTAALVGAQRAKDSALSWSRSISR